MTRLILYECTGVFQSACASLFHLKVVHRNGSQTINTALPAASVISFTCETLIAIGILSVGHWLLRLLAYLVHSKSEVEPRTMSLTMFA